MASIDEADDFKFLGLGGCSEVGRSCHIIEYKNKVIMLDAGIHPGLTGLNSLPFFDEYDLSKVDVLLISHFHLDHAASLPYVMQHTNFRGRVFMTHATKSIYRWLLTDFVRVTSLSSNTGNDPNSSGSSANLYTDDDLMKSFDRIETIDFHSTIELDGIRFTAYHAGHVLGACLYFIEIGGLKILFTGDYSREENRHLPVAEVPSVKPDILITESTFGTATHEPRQEKEERMTRIIHSTLKKGGRVLMPVFALGTAQELLLILEDYWAKHDDLHNTDIYFASSLARKCLAVYQTYTNIMNDKIRSLTSSSTYRKDPFSFKYIKTLKSLDRFQDFGPSVVIASPGMLQSGFSRQLLEKWAPDPKNTVLMTGYSVEGTMAKDLLIEPPTIPSITNPDMTIPRRISIEEISFAAHVDFQQNAEFIGEVNALKIILVHGDSIPMGRLKSALLSKYSHRKGTDQEVRVFNPRNGDQLRIAIKGSKVAEVVGGLAQVQISALRSEIEHALANKIEEIGEEEETEAENDENDDKDNDTDVYQSKEVLSGVIVSKDFDLNIVQLQDLHEYSLLSTSIVKSKIDMVINAHISLIEWHLQQMFGYINILNDDEDEWECNIMDMISVLVDRSKSKGSSNYVVVEWVNDNLMADSLADSVVAILYSIDSSPASVKISSQTHKHEHEHENDEETTKVKEEKESEPIKHGHTKTDISERIYRISTLLKAQFGDAVTHDDNKKAQIAFGKNEATIDYTDLSVTCNSKVLKDRLENILKRGTGLAAPLSQYEKSV